MKNRIGLVSLLVISLLLVGCFGGAKEYTISGTILDYNDEPLKDVALNISGADYDGTAKTDANGKWQATVKGDVTVTPSLAEYYFDPTDREVNEEGENYDFTGHLLAAYDISGKAIDQNNAGVAGIILKIEDDDGEQTVTTDANGNWSATVNGPAALAVEPVDGRFITPTVISEIDQPGSDYNVLAYSEIRIDASDFALGPVTSGVNPWVNIQNNGTSIPTVSNEVDGKQTFKFYHDDKGGGGGTNTNNSDVFRIDFSPQNSGKVVFEFKWYAMQNNLLSINARPIGIAPEGGATQPAQFQFHSGGSVRLNSRGNTVLPDSAYRVKEWEQLKLVMDIDAQIYYIYLNDKLINGDAGEEGDTFSTESTSINAMQFFYQAYNDRYSEFYLDDIVITHEP